MNTARVSIPIPDLVFAPSVETLDQALHSLPGVVDVYVSSVTDSAYVAFDPERCTERHLQDAIRKAGFHLPPPR